MPRNQPAGEGAYSKGEVELLYSDGCDLSQKEILQSVIRYFLVGESEERLPRVVNVLLVWLFLKGEATYVIYDRLILYLQRPGGRDLID